MVRINLLPVRVSKKKVAGNQQLLLFALLLVGGVLANGIYHGRRAAELETLEKRVAETRQDIVELDKVIGEVKSIRTQQQQLQEKLDTLAKLKQGRTGPVRMLDELATIIPRRIWLDKLEEKAGKVTLAGGATSIEDVSQYMAALRSSKSFGDVELKRTEGRLEKGLHTVKFTIVATARYVTPVPAGAAGGKG
jgi:type IV pilus assembly protein PilN